MGFWALAIPALASVAGGLLANKSAKKGAAAATAPRPFNETTTRTPYGPALPLIEDILRIAGGLGQGAGAPSPFTPSAWGLPGHFTARDDSPPSLGAAAPPRPSAGSEDPRYAGLSERQISNRQARAERQSARTAARQQPQGPSGGQAQIGSQGASGAPPSGLAGFAQGPLGGGFQGPEQILQGLYSQLLGGGFPMFNLGSGYAQNLMGGQVANPLLQQTFQRASGYTNPYLQQFIERRMGVPGAASQPMELSVFGR